MDSKKWTITFVTEGGGPTLQEESSAAQRALFSDVETDPDIATVLNHFPGAKIVDIRLNKQENDLDLTLHIFDNEHDDHINDE